MALAVFTLSSEDMFRRIILVNVVQKESAENLISCLYQHPVPGQCEHGVMLLDV